MKDSTKNQIHMSQVMLHAPDRLDFPSGEVLPNLRIVQQFLFQITTFSSHFQGVSLNHSVRGVPGNSFLDQRQQDLLREKRTAALFQIAQHIFRIDT